MFSSATTLLRWFRQIRAPGRTACTRRRPRRSGRRFSGSRARRDLLRSVGWWYLLPFAPGVIVPGIAQALARPERTTRIIASSVAMFLIAVGVYALNWRAAKRIQRRIDRLKENV